MNFRSLLAHSAIATALVVTTATAQVPGPAANSDVYGHVGIGTIAPNRSALLDLTGTDVGLLIPRLTTTQRNAIALPAKSLLIFNTDANEFQYNWGTPAVPDWRPILDGANAGNTAWILTGNNGPFTDGTNNLLGTNAGAGDRQVNIQANGQRTIRLVPNATSPTIIGGFSGNTASGAGVTISGGGQAGNLNTATGDFATIGGGSGNIASALAATIGGGDDNDATGAHSTVGGGDDNDADGDHSTIGGGEENDADGEHSTIGGGDNNEAEGAHSFIGGGLNNDTDGDFSTVAGGDDNDVEGNYDFIGGGQENTTAGGEHNAIVGGVGNTITPNDGGTITSSFIGGGDDNRIQSFPGSDVSVATIGGGSANIIQSNNAAVTTASTIGGGDNNGIYNSGAATIAGGRGNVINSELDVVDYYPGNSIGGGTDNFIGPGDGGFAAMNTIGGGNENSIRANGGLIEKSTIGGGESNFIRAGIAPQTSNTIGGGFDNTVDQSDYATISGGNTNMIDGANGSAIVGGQNNTVTGDNSMAFGNGANVSQDNSVVFNHTTGTPTRVGVAANNPQVAMDVNGGLAVRNANVSFPAGASPKVLNVTVGDRSYIRVTSDGVACTGIGCVATGLGTTQRSITLTSGNQVGQVLVIECVETAAGDGFRVLDADANVNTNILGPVYSMQNEDTLILMWNGTNWIEVGRSNN
ncbi:MAG: hypothetical protein IT211_04345 [Armatimonadetes bacterium]|nr:hypothetical protein [Armatimonadota bacterium]